jgi:hypothetical protein
MTADVIKTWLAAQTSYDYRADPATIEVVPDPRVTGTWAAQFTDLKYREPVQLLFVTGGETGSDAEVLDRCLEEVEFDSWPPVSGNLQFFW